MKEQDIKKIFSIAADGAENGIESEEIKTVVLEKLGKRAAEVSENTDNEETVKPVFVTVSKNRRGRNIKIAAGAAAACLGISVLGVSLIEGNVGVTPPLSQNVNLPSKRTDADIFAERKEAKSWLYELDQSYHEPGYGYSDYAANLSYLLSEEDGRLYFIKRAEGIKIGQSNEEIKEDITDLISYDDYYLYTYENPYNKDNPTHYILAGGNLAENDYGYMELFKYGDYWSWLGKCSSDSNLILCSQLSDTAAPEYSRSKWLINGIKEIEKISGEKIMDVVETVDGREEIVHHFSSGGWLSDTDFKDVWKNENYDSIELTLFDGGTFEYTMTADGGSSHDYANHFCPLSEENGKLYFVKNAGDIGYDRKDEAKKEDITDKINSEGFYIYAYNNYYNKEYHTHYIIVGGDIANNDYGFAELFKVNGHWEYSGALSKAYSNDHDIDDPTGAMWLNNGINELEKSYGEKIIGNQINGGMQSNFNFNNLWTDAQDTVKFMLLDGNSIWDTTANGEPNLRFDLNNSTHLLSEENGKLYFVKNAGEIDLSRKSEAIKEDITDKISSDNFYIYSYNNPDNTEYSTHYIIVGGDIANNDYGYIELFKSDGIWHSAGNFTKDTSALPNGKGFNFFTPGNPGDSGDNSAKPQWFINGVNELDKNYGEQIAANFDGGVYRGEIDFKNVWADDNTDSSYPDINLSYPDMDSLPLNPDGGQELDPEFEDWLGERADLKNNTFTLKDGTKIEVKDNDKYGICSYRVSMNHLIAEKDGRLYYLGGEEPKDITDLVDENTPFVVYYENEESGLTHCIAIGGNVETGVYGYAEMFRLRERSLAFDWLMNDSGNTDDDGATAQEWFKKAANEYMNLPEGGYHCVGGGGYRNLSDATF